MERGKALVEHFSTLKDPRMNRKKLYPLMEILFVVLCGSICGADAWRDFVLFGKGKRGCLREYFPYKNGIPSKNTFARLFARLNQEAFRECFVQWVKSFQEALDKVVAIEGKKVRHSFDTAAEQSAIHMVSAFGTQTKLVLGQVKVDEKSNEITAIPILLKLLDLRGSVVTIDAMGCQKEIAQKIIEKEADYVLALKGNQGTLHEDVQLFLETECFKENSVLVNEYYEEADKGHGRIENRRCWVSDTIDWLEQKAEWSKLQTVALLEEVRKVGEKESIERRFFITSLPADAKQIASVVRAHWGIENTLHWSLDRTFREDESRVRKGNAAENMAIVRHIAHNMLQNAKKGFKDISLRALRKLSGWGDSTLDLVLKQTF